jgi:integrase
MRVWERLRMQAKLTKATVEKMPSGSIIWDQQVIGFGARRQTKGIFYYLRYRLNGSQRMLSIGRHGSPWTVEQARKEAQRLLGSVVTGVDPFAKQSAAEMFGACVEQYLDRKRASVKPRSFEEIKRHLLVNAKPLHSRRLGEIDRRAIAIRLAEIEAASGPVARNRVRSSLSAFFAWCIREGLLESNPVLGTGKADEGGPRERVLSKAEIKAIWLATGEVNNRGRVNARDDAAFADIVRLLLLTGQRREEISGLRWSEVDWDNRQIVLPKERTKNRREHCIPLSEAALVILRRQANAEGDRQANDAFVFGRYRSWSDGKAALDQRLGLAPWRLHDLRRTAATGMAEIGVLPHIIEAVLNHVGGFRAGVAGIYNRARYEGEMREALARWADWVEALAAK